AATVVAAAALAPFAAAASYGDAVNGVEIAATSVEGTFTGIATGNLPGTWTAVIDHTKLSPNATITGGSFTLNTVLNGSLAQVVGAFAPGGGSVTLLNPGSQCVNQYYHVVGTLGNVGVGGPGSGTGGFDATLTHFRVFVPFVGCTTYFATVSGSLTLQL